ncbi:hypothetical protein [Arthrobacter sp. zg-Y1116]|uniref:hypothetical protein n=1 Tax=Arthrobacter sp. zg-Y1116 TaxID=2964611 RepID=UPI002103898C|nr:hypothetical protein [Arthrobacter sp. zg-Y1116]MCQ1946035.1 hypothetical protein [Arthrobacter sp. zg-Y1116]
MNRNRLSPAAPAPASDPAAPARRRRYLAGLGVIALGAAALAGCAADSGLAPVSESSADPFEIYLAEDMDAIHLAQDTLRFQCYADNGYPEYEAFIPEEPAVQWRADLLDQLTVDDAFFESVQDATAGGLRGEQFGPSPAKVFVHDDAFEAVSEACNTKAWAALGENAEQSLIDYNRLSSKLAGGLADRTFEALGPLQQEVVQCLVDAGVPVTPASGELYGFTSDVELGTAVEYPERSGPKQASGVEIIPADVEITYAPTPAEAALAVKYYNCSVETGVRDEFDALILETKKEVVAEHAAELEKANPRIAELAAAARELTVR